MTDRPRICVVTGGALGIGGAISRRFARAGDLVVLNDVDGDAARAAQLEIEAAGGRCAVVVGDITDDDVVAETAGAALSAGDGRVDVLVNNVGDFRPTSWTFARSTPEQWRRLYELNLHHVFTMTHALLPAMIEQRRGAIVNNSTVEAFRGIPGKAAYSAFNAGVSAFTKSLAVEVGQHGVRVNAIAPDLADTPQTPADAMLRGRDPELIRTWVPLGRFGAADDYAAAVQFLASDAACYITGHTLPVDGGTLAASGWYGRADGKGWTNFPNNP
ncbi:SDR family NAD(P)-dependent oxidoreductase [Saccharopolyspora shandongensis]|uniref:NAD(P)-dependent dehydrogenase, short-chain alcohol dehydrogenase family n=1 Tax=Saccharopolyspora shandongensis TaxID=418495 RepID=A0A1H3E4G5_9PSEU|nr:SDR family NAD(P)-dependent oxidoreductase [Saccharopolyspora shandongensis]SDX73571.1 NAD(P)-dependent dehydrogenase, short-chain alcohol dehydrogenase family [Saccharopolyspora shandongensis]